jgi:SAM-dependent methyltransferase
LAQTRPRPTRLAIDRFYPEEYEVGVDAGTGAKGLLPRPALIELRDLPARLRYGRQRGQAPAAATPTLLEIGCGGGRDLARYAAAGWDVWAIEPMASVATLAAERAGVDPDRIATVPAEEADFPPGAFDRIIMFHTIEHLHDPLEVLRAAQRWLRCGGELQISCPNYASLQRRLFGRHWFGLDVPRHLYHFTPSTLTAMLASAGFSVGTIVPEHEYCSIGVSLSLTLDAMRHSSGPARISRKLHLAAMPFSVFARTLGAKPCMFVTAGSASHC